MQWKLTFILFYTLSGYIESGKFIQEERKTYSQAESALILERCLGLVNRDRAKSWSHTFQIVEPSGHYWVISQAFDDREKKWFMVTYNEAWNIQGTPKRMKWSQVIETVLGQERG